MNKHSQNSLESTLRNVINVQEEPMELENVIFQQQRLAGLLKYKGNIPAYFRRKRHGRVKASRITNSSSSDLYNQQDLVENYRDPALDFLHQGLITFREANSEFLLPASLNNNFKQKFNSPNRSFYHDIFRNDNHFPLNLIEEPRIKNEFKISNLLSGEIMAAADVELDELKRRPLGSTRMAMLDANLYSKRYSTKKNSVAQSEDDGLVKPKPEGGGYLSYRNTAYVTYDPKVAQLLNSPSPTKLLLSITDNFLPSSNKDAFITESTDDTDHDETSKNIENFLKNSRSSTWCDCDNALRTSDANNYGREEEEEGKTCIECGKLTRSYSNEETKQVLSSQSMSGDQFENRRDSALNSKKQQYFLMLKKANIREPSWSENTARRDLASASANHSALARSAKDDKCGINYQDSLTNNPLSLAVQKEQYRLAYDQAIRCHRNAAFTQHVKNGGNPMDFFNQRTSRVTFSYFDYLPRYSRGLEIFRYANPPRDLYRERMLNNKKPTPKQLTFGDQDPDWYLTNKKNLNK